jgi:hypothetical protein
MCIFDKILGSLSYDSGNPTAKGHFDPLSAKSPAGILEGGIMEVLPAYAVIHTNFDGGKDRRRFL